MICSYTRDLLINYYFRCLCTCYACCDSYIECDVCATEYVRACDVCVCVRRVMCVSERHAFYDYCESEHIMEQIYI